MQLAAAGVVKLGNNVMPLAAATTVSNNIMPLATATLLAATAVVKRADTLRTFAPPLSPSMSPQTAGTGDALPSSTVRGSGVVNKG